MIQRNMQQGVRLVGSGSTRGRFSLWEWGVGSGEWDWGVGWGLDSGSTFEPHAALLYSCTLAPWLAWYFTWY